MTGRVANNLYVVGMMIYWCSSDYGKICIIYGAPGGDSMRERLQKRLSMHLGRDWWLVVKEVAKEVRQSDNSYLHTVNLCISAFEFIDSIWGII